MFYLAKVQCVGTGGSRQLVPLIYRPAEGKDWLLLSSGTEGDSLMALAKMDVDEASLPEGEGFVLVELAHDGRIFSIQDAASWMLLIIQQYLDKRLTPEFLMREAQRAEEWRQSLTLQSQDVARRSLEVETRRDQIQELERGLEDKRLKLEGQMDALATEKQRLEEERLRLEQDKQLFFEQQQAWEQKKLHGLRE